MSKDKSKKAKDKEKRSGACNICSCPQFRSDNGEPERCINIRPPLKELCGHLRSEHK